MTPSYDQPPLFTYGFRPYSLKTEADELRVAILDHVGQTLQRTIEPEGAACPRCGEQLRALVGSQAPGGDPPSYAYCRSCLWWSKVHLQEACS